MTDLVAERDEIKKVIRSLLVSAPRGLTPYQLEKDYKQITGNHLPYQKFHFTTNLEFLRSLNDVLHFHYDGYRVTVYGIADASTKHIMAMVQKQKKPRSYNSLRDTTPAKKVVHKSPPKKSTGIYVPAFIRNGIYKVVKAFPNGFSLTFFPHLYTKVNGVTLGSNVDGFATLKDLVLAVPDVARLEFGRSNSKGENLYVYPSKVLRELKNSKENKDDKQPTTDKSSNVSSKTNEKAKRPIIVPAQKKNIKIVLSDKTKALVENSTESNLKPLDKISEKSSLVEKEISTSKTAQNDNQLINEKSA
uniref:HTH OST-type domain-containing protein n=1 Tax=Ciona savignyi TaxID=51511 RepID=H2YLA8_CIOSA